MKFNLQNTHMHTHTHTHAHTHKPAHTHTCTHARTHTQTHIHTHTRTHARTHTCTHTRTHTNTHTQTHTHKHTHTYTHTHTHTHTHTQLLNACVHAGVSWQDCSPEKAAQAENKKSVNSQPTAASSIARAVSQQSLPSRLLLMSTRRHNYPAITLSSMRSTLILRVREKCVLQNGDVSLCL